MELTNPEREMIASTLIAYRAAKMPVSAMQQAFDEIDAVLVKRKPLASIPEQGALTGGVALIAAERQRQINVEGWTPLTDEEWELISNGWIKAIPQGVRTFINAVLVQRQLKQRIARRPAPAPAPAPDRCERCGRYKNGGFCPMCPPMPTPAPAPEPDITNVPGNQPSTVSSGEMSPTSFVVQSAPRVIDKLEYPWERKPEPAPQQDDAAVVEEMYEALVGAYEQRTGDTWNHSEKVELLSDLHAVLAALRAAGELEESNGQ